MTDAVAAIDLDSALVSSLVSDQFPELSSLKIQHLKAQGTDNHLFRVGDNLCARFPKTPWAVDTASREAAALPRFSESPITVPEVYGLGEPAHGYPYNWSILDWLPGRALEDGALHDPGRAARALGRFFDFVRSVPVDPAFLYGPENNGRGAPLATRTLKFEAALARLPGIDAARARRLWSSALDAGTDNAPVWLHGDVHPGNLLIQEGHISGVIDWGLCGVGDGACDLLSAWAVFDGLPRKVFRTAMGAGDADWLRGAGWALSMAVIYLPYAYENGLRSDMSEKMIARLMEDFA